MTGWPRGRSVALCCVARACIACTSSSGARLATRACWFRPAGLGRSRMSGAGTRPLSRRRRAGGGVRRARRLPSWNGCDGENEKLARDLARTQTALDIMGKAHNAPGVALRERGADARAEADRLIAEAFADRELPVHGHVVLRLGARPGVSRPRVGATTLARTCMTGPPPSPATSGAEHVKPEQRSTTIYDTENLRLKTCEVVPGAGVVSEVRLIGRITVRGLSPLRDAVVATGGATWASASSTGLVQLRENGAAGTQRRSAAPSSARHAIRVWIRPPNNAGLWQVWTSGLACCSAIQQILRAQGLGRYERGSLMPSPEDTKAASTRPAALATVNAPGPCSS